MATSKTTGLPSMAVAQINLQDSAKELRSAQKAFELAKQRLDVAEEGHGNAIATFSKESEALRAACKVVPLGSR